MVRYFYSFTPLVIVGTVVILSLPWLGLIALMVFLLSGFAVVAALAWAVVATPYLLVRSIGRRRNGRGNAREPGAALSLAERKRV